PWFPAPVARGPAPCGRAPVYHARDARGAGGMVLAPFSWLHLRPQVLHPRTPWAGRRLAGSSGSPPLLSEMTWSTVSLPPCPQIQQSVDAARTWARTRRQGLPLRPRLRVIVFPLVPVDQDVPAEPHEERA